MSEMSREQLHDKAREVIRRAILDASFGEQLRSEPRAALLAAGYPEAAVDDFIQNDLGLEAEVAGYRGCEWTCVLITCDVTASCGETF